MKTKVSLTVIFSMIGVVAFTQSLTLQQCIDYALTNNTNVQNALIDQEISDNDDKEFRTKALPHVDGDVDYVHNFNIQKIILENGVIPAFTDPAAKPGQVIAFQLQLKNTLTLGASASQVIYDKSLFAGIHGSDTYKQLSEKKVRRSKIDVAEAVTKAFYGVLVAQKQFDFLGKNLARVDSLYKETAGRYKSGVARKIDVDRIEVRLNNLKEEREKSSKIVELNKTLLMFQMNYDPKEPLNISGDLDESLLAVAPPSPETFDYQNRIEYSILKSQRELNNTQLGVIKGQYVPRLSAFATSGYNPAATNLGDIFQGSRYYNYTFVGLKLQVPIFHGFEKRYKVANQLLEGQKLDNTIRNTERSIDLQIRQAEITMQNGIESLKIQKRNLSLAQENVKVIRAENAQGIATNLEVTNAEADLNEAQNNYYNALYTALISKTDLDKAMGTLVVQ
ncbi:MAG TPA: TolC family protein [Cyclobacteriaceae bacterium]|nr:TolC family protein [Cyclobacteriaceae bacterium]